MEEVLSVRRRSTPNLVRKLWSCIKTIRYQRQTPSIDRITRYMAREYHLTEEQTFTQLSYCVQEGLIRHTRFSGKRGSKTGVEQEAYRLPKVELNRDSHDWYCWKCHKSGEVIKCNKCFRVFHLNCLEDFENINNKFVCQVCYKIFNEEEIITRAELNELLSYSCKRLIKILVIKKKSEALIPQQIKSESDADYDSESDGGQMVDLSNDDWQNSFLIFKYMDLNIMYKRLMDVNYVNFESFLADAELLYHNTVILYGAESVEGESVLYMVDECKRDVKEIHLCKDCFRESNVRSSYDWFCLPCNPPHKLVYAKQKGYCYWPAKVIKVENDNYDVRFFGGSYARAIIHKKYIRPVSENIFNEVKRNVSWNRAYTELLKHQEYLVKQKENMSNTKKAPDVQEQNCNGTKKQMGNTNGHSDLSLPTLQSKHTNNTMSNSHNKSHHGDTCNISSDDSPLSPKRFKKFKSLQAPRSGLSVKNLGFDPNALQEEMGKFILEDANEMQTSIKRTKSLPQLDNISPSMSSLDSLSSFENDNWSIQNEQREELINISNCETSQVNTVMQKLSKVIENKKNQEIKFLKLKHKKELYRFQRDVKKLENVIRKQYSKHKKEILEVKKIMWCQECFKKATYYCCWNTSYCSTACQNNHWQIHQHSCQH